MLSNNQTRAACRFAVLVLCCLIIWQPQDMFAQSGESIEELKRKATELTKQMKYTEALPILEKLAIAEPDNPSNHFYLGFALIAQMNTTKSPESRKALRLRALAAFVRAKELGIQEPVIDGLIKSVGSDTSDTTSTKTYSQHPEANKVMEEGQAAVAQGKTDDALASYLKALQLDPTLYDAALFAGNVFIQRGDFTQASAWYQKRSPSIRAGKQPIVILPRPSCGKVNMSRRETFTSKPSSRSPTTSIQRVDLPNGRR